MGGKTKSKTEVKVPPPTVEERRQKALSEAINLRSLYDSGVEAVWDEASGTYTIKDRPLTPEEQEAKNRDKELYDLAYSKLTAKEEGKTVTDEDRALVSGVFQSQRDAGNEELKRFLGEQASARGMSVADTPLLRELGLQKGTLESDLRGAESAALLDVGHRQQIFGQALREFSAGLKQQAFMNRAAIGESAAQTALGLGRLRGMNQTSTTTTSGGGFNFASALMGGAQGVMMGGQSGGPWGAVAGGIGGFGLGGLGGMR